jgi:hypothetical protein
MKYQDPNARSAHLSYFQQDTSCSSLADGALTCVVLWRGGEATDANPFAGEARAGRRPGVVAAGTPEAGGFIRGERTGGDVTREAPGADGEDSVRVASSTCIRYDTKSVSSHKVVEQTFRTLDNFSERLGSFPLVPFR